MKNSLSSLPGGLLAAFYRNQSDEVKQNIRRALRVFSLSEVKVNLSKGNSNEKEKAL